MKKIIYKLLLINWKTLLAFLLVTTGTLQAQWDQVNFNDDAGSIYLGTLDPDDNIYSVGYGGSIFPIALRRHDPSGNLLWVKDLSGLLTDFNNQQGQVIQGASGGVEFGNNSVFTVGQRLGNGVIVKSEIDETAPAGVIWEELVSPPGTESIITDIKIHGNDLYMVGVYDSENTSLLSFDDGMVDISGQNTITFIAKYTIAPKQLQWVTQIDATDFVKGSNIDVDNLNNVFISGHFRGTAAFYNNGSAELFPSEGAETDTFLAKFDPLGNFDSQFGLKTNNAQNESALSRDVRVSDYNDAVYWAEAHYLRAFNKNDEGLHLWTYELLPSTASYVSGIATNECGDGELYATGFISSPGACEGDFWEYRLTLFPVT